jgi:hypothetical protein
VTIPRSDGSVRGLREQIFAVEMCMKIFGLGFRGYVADTFNIFDGTIVVVSFVEVPPSCDKRVNRNSCTPEAGVPVQTVH